MRTPGPSTQTNTAAAPTPSATQPQCRGNGWGKASPAGAEADSRITISRSNVSPNDAPTPEARIIERPTGLSSEAKTNLHHVVERVGQKGDGGNREQVRAHCPMVP